MAVTVRRLHDDRLATAGGFPLSTEVHDVLWGTTSDLTAKLTTKLKRVVAVQPTLIGTPKEVSSWTYKALIGATSGMYVNTNTGSENLTISRAPFGGGTVAGTIGVASVRTTLLVLGTGG